MNRLRLCFAVLLALVGLADTLAWAKDVAPAAAKAAGDVTMYVMPDCGYCEKARQHLSSLGVTWQERDIASSEQAQADFEAKGGQGTPLLQIGPEVIMGYQPKAVEASLHKHGVL